MSKNASNTLPTACSSQGLERPRYFPRQLITPTEMTLEQEYFRNRLRLHNRLLHGWGVVCGALVCRVPKADGQPTECEPWLVKVEKGYILGPYGDEILIDCERQVDLRKASLTDEACASSDSETVDPWCSEVLVPREAGSYWVAVKYSETAARPVRSQPTGCGCDDSQCEYSRWRDGYEICVFDWDSCPESHQGTPPNILDLFSGSVRDCPSCPDQPWVVLAEVEVDGDGTIQRIDNCSCRRMVTGVGEAWWRCQHPAGRSNERIVSLAVEPRRKLYPGEKSLVDVLGAAVGAARSVTVSDGVEAAIKEAGRNKMVLELTVDGDAPPGPRRMSFRDSRGRFLTALDDAIIVEKARRPPAEKKATPRARKPAAKKTAKKPARAKKPANQG